MQRVTMVLFMLFFFFPPLLFAEPIEINLQESYVLSSQNGHFVFGNIPGSPHGPFMLDTKTGRLWVMVAVGTQAELSLVPVPYRWESGKTTFLPVMPPDMRGK